MFTLHNSCWRYLSMLMLCVLLVFVCSPGSAHCQDSKWKFVIRVTGVVKCQLARQAIWSTIWNGRMLHDGDKAKTLEKSRAKILLPDNSFFIVGENSAIEIEKIDYSQKGRVVQIKMDAGKMRFKVQKFAAGESDFKVITPKAVLAVRGTEVYVSQEPPAPTGEPGPTNFTVFSGELNVNTGTQSQSFTAGQTGHVDAHSHVGAGHISGNSSSSPQSGGSSSTGTTSGSSSTGSTGTGGTTTGGTGTADGGSTVGSSGQATGVDADLAAGTFGASGSPSSGGGSAPSSSGGSSSSGSGSGSSLPGADASGVPGGGTGGSVIPPPIPTIRTVRTTFIIR